MAANLSSRFKPATEIPPVNNRRGYGPRIQGAALDVATYIIRWDEESDDPKDWLRVIECVDDNEAKWVYQTCQNASHCSMVNHETKFAYDTCKRGCLIFLVRKFRRTKLQDKTTKKEWRR